MVENTFIARHTEAGVPAVDAGFCVQAADRSIAYLAAGDGDAVTGLCHGHAGGFKTGCLRHDPFRGAARAPGRTGIRLAAGRHRYAVRRGRGYGANQPQAYAGILQHQSRRPGRAGHRRVHTPGAAGRDLPVAELCRRRQRPVPALRPAAPPYGLHRYHQPGRRRPIDALAVGLFPAVWPGRNGHTGHQRFPGRIPDPVCGDYYTHGPAWQLWPPS